MVKLPREEIEYENLYKNLDLDKNLQIKWPKVQDCSEIVLVDEYKHIDYKYRSKTLDEYDILFCKTFGIKQNRFSKIINRIQNIWERHVFSQLDNLQPYESDFPCDICGKSDECKNNIIIICNGCGIPVHQDCYGIPNINDKFWFCSSCIFPYEQKACKFCNMKRGILKRTETNEWCHVICCLLTPSLSFSNVIYKDPVEISHFKPLYGICEICQEESESMIKCSYKSCSKRFHPSCASETLYCDIGNKIAYCNEHDCLKKYIFNIKSKKRIFEERNLYKDLKHDIIIRENTMLNERISTPFNKIINSEPNYDLTKSIKNFKESEVKRVFEYWNDKRKAFKTYFTDMFQFTNYLNKAN